MASMRRTIARHIDSAEAKQDRKHRRSAAKAWQIAEWRKALAKAQRTADGERTAEDEAQDPNPPAPKPSKLRSLASLFGRGAKQRRTQGR
jgi:hypothetical protein